MRARDNPFRTERVHQVRYRLLDGTWGEVMRRLRELDYRAAIVGPDGSGKTTLLEDLAPRLAKLGFTTRSLFLNDRKRTLGPTERGEFFARLGANDVILFDGADLMGRLAWARFKRRTRGAAGLIVTSHRSGLLPTLIECRTTPELLDDIVVQILGDGAGLGELPHRLFEKHQGNLRDALRELYDMYSATAPATDAR